MMRRYKAVIVPSVRLSIAEAKSWYRHQDKDLVKRLSIQIDAAVQSVMANPEGFSIRISNLRRINLKVFPYAFYYSIDEERGQIVFSSFFHVKMNVPYSDSEGPELTLNEP